MNQSVEIITPSAPWEAFARNYLAVRKLEGRLLSDEAVSQLPIFVGNAQLEKEWQKRARGANTLVRILKNKFKPYTKILDIGCGNGWLSHKLALAGFDVTGADVNLPELEQATRLFSGQNLRFVFADVFHWSNPPAFEVAIVASAIQYFEQPQMLFQTLFKNIPSLQSIIISDSPLYANPAETQAASDRSRKYYENLKEPNMAAYYHHHSTNVLGTHFHYLYQPGRGLLQRFLHKTEFPIIEILRV